jgi:hypothetical protein
MPNFSRRIALTWKLPLPLRPEGGAKVDCNQQHYTLNTLNKTLQDDAQISVGLKKLEEAVAAYETDSKAARCLLPKAAKTPKKKVEKNQEEKKAET